MIVIVMLMNIIMIKMKNIVIAQVTLDQNRIKKGKKQLSTKERLSYIPTSSLIKCVY